MALVRVTVQLRDSLPAEILLYVTSRSKLLDVLGGMGLEVEDDLEVSPVQSPEPHHKRWSGRVMGHWAQAMSI